MFSSAHTLNSRSLDVGRGIAIVAVMYGHALAPWFMSAGANFSEPAYLQWKFGASFMMPFFFLLSGVAWRTERSLEVTFRQSVTLVVMTLLASMAFDVIRVILTLGGVAAAVGIEGIDPLGYIKHALKMLFVGSNYSMGALWFLTALGVVRVLAALVLRAGVATTVACAALLLALTFASTEWGWINFYQINLLGVGFAFFLAGHATRDLWLRVISAPRWCLAALIVSGAVVAALFDLNRGCRWEFNSVCGLAWLNGHFGVTMIHGEFGNLALFAVTAVFGVIFAATLSVLLARFAGPVGERLARWGRKSLNLLIVNCISLELLNGVVSRFVAPGLPANNAPFFVGLLAFTIALNLLMAHLLAHRLRQLLSLSSDIAACLVKSARQILAPVIVGMGAPRVSQVYGNGRARRGAL